MLSDQTTPSITADQKSKQQSHGVKLGINFFLSFTLRAMTASLDICVALCAASGGSNALRDQAASSAHDDSLSEEVDMTNLSNTTTFAD